jgi:hypothetical protein
MSITERQKAVYGENCEKVPQTMQNVFRKAFSGDSKAAAIKAKCLECSLLQREEVKLCTVETCPLWPYRPFHSGAESENEVENEAS